MGGKRLKFPVRKKFVPSDATAKPEKKEEEHISEEEHQKRLKLLRDMGIIKD